MPFKKYADKIKNMRTFESLSVRDFRLLWGGQLFTSMGQWMDQATRSWLIFEMTKSPLQLGIVSALRGAPLLFFGVIAGVVADRYGRKAQLIIAQTVNAILNIILATLVITGHIEVWHVYVTAFLSGTVQAFQQPARQVLINDLVGQKHLLNAVALNSTAFNVSRSIGPILSGVLIAMAGGGMHVDLSYYAQAALFAFATIWTIQIKVPEASKNARRATAGSGNSIFADAKEGFSYIVHNRLILGLMILGLAPILLGMPYTSLMPVFAVDVFHGDVNTQDILLGAVGVGAIIGSLAVASIGGKQGNGKLLIGGAACFGAALILFSRMPMIQFALFFVFLAGFFNASYGSQDMTIVQTLTPANLRGRVLGIYFINRALMPLGSLVAGAIAEYWGGPMAVTIMGTSCVLVAVAVAIFIPDLWKLTVLKTTEEPKMKAVQETAGPGKS